MKILLRYGATVFYFRNSYEILSFIDQCKKEMWREKTANRKSLPKPPAAVSFQKTHDDELLAIEKMVDKLTTDQRDEKIAPPSSYAKLGVALRPLSLLRDDISALATPTVRNSPLILHFFQELNSQRTSIVSTPVSAASSAAVESLPTSSAPKTTAALTS